PGLEVEEATITVEAGKVAQLTTFSRIARSWEAEAADDTIEVLGRAVAPEITERVLSADEIRYLPGSNGDVVKAIQNLPGIARPPLGIGQLIVRGTSPEDSAYYVDGIAIPLAFHFGGLATVIPSDAIEEVAFLPGNYGVRYGRVLGGVVDIRTTQTLPERSRGYVSVDIFQANVFAEQRISERTAITLSGRRSYADAVLNPILKGMDGVNIRAPRYYDLQARLLHRTPNQGTLDVLFLLSDDRFRFVGLDDEGEEEETAQIGLVQQFSRLRARYTQPLGKGWRSETSVGIGPENQEFELGGSGKAFEKAWAADVRSEFYKPVPEDGWFGMRMGLDARTDRVSFLIDVPSFGDGRKEEFAGWRTRPAVYAEPTFKVGRLTLVPGIRAGAQLIDAHQSAWVDPRVAAGIRAGSSTKIKLAVGKYSQPALARQVLQVPDLGANWSFQTGIGIEQEIGERVSIEVNRFYNWLGNGVVGRDDAFRFFTGPPPVGPFDTDDYGNEGTGRIAGLEGSIRYKDRRLIALATATLSRSVRIDRSGEERLFAFDQPVVLNALASYELPKGWRIGGRVRLSSGNPFTPVVNRIFNHDTRGFIPVYGERDSDRLPNFWSVDIRVDKEWTFDRWGLTAYLDIQNATNNQNIEVMGWSYDFREEAPTAGLPLLPAFGLRADW
ncbi:MAG: TonB-dependent receptor plug domain-containing protein, partial [Myxococcota bacterium]